MKTRSKVLSLVLAGTLVVSAGMFGTLAYLTDTAEVTNNFTVGKVDITLDEAKVNVDGEIVPEADRVMSNNYKLMPGGNYTKDPTVHVTGDSEDSYLFVKVENGIAGIEDGETVSTQMDNNGWDLVDGTENIYVYTQEGTIASVEGGTDVSVFEEFTIKEDVTNKELDECKGKTIIVTAYAIQADGFENMSAKQIWDKAGFGTTTVTE